MMLRSILISSALLASCGPPPSPARDAAAGSDTGNGGGNNADAACTTSLSGKVYAPNGKLPLYNVAVYVPATTPPPIVEGVTCQQCVQGLPGGAIASTFSDASGKFRLEGIPAGINIPVILSTGKWRRQINVPLVTACTNTTLPDGTFRLPRNQIEGSIPRIAIVTGGCDAFACLASKLGIDASEFGWDSAMPTRVVFYDGAGGASPGTAKPAEQLWGNFNELSKFDLVINTCECDVAHQNKTNPDILRKYADLGGRIFASHSHYTWGLSLVPEWAPLAGWSPLTAPGTGPSLVDTSHSHGEAFARWLVATGASWIYGQALLEGFTDNVSYVAPPAKRWLYSSDQAVTHYLSFNTPVDVPASQRCGKYGFAGLHLAPGGTDQYFPASCGIDLSIQEMALVFLWFELTSCVEPFP